MKTTTETAFEKTSDYHIEKMEENEKEISPLHLDMLPIEILMYICDFVDAKTIIKSLANVCQTFHDLFCDDGYWKLRISKRWPGKYPSVPVDDFDWRDGCIAREEIHRIWENQDQYLDYITYNEGLFAAVDTVHLMMNGSILAAGSRDRYLTVLNLDRYNSKQPDTKTDMKVYSDSKVHKGWIWSLASLNSTLATGSWDTYIRLFDVEAGCKQIADFKCKSAVLCLYIEPGLIVAGAYDKQVCFVDPRDGKKTFKRLHRRPVLTVAADDKYIITGSEDKTIKVYDRRAASIFKSIQLEDCYALDFSYGNNQLWFGDKGGNLHLIDASDDKFNIVDTYDVGHTGKLTGVQHSDGAIFTSSSDYTVKVLEPSLNPATITTLTHHQGDVAGISYLNGVLATASCDISIGIWRPKYF